MPTSPQPLVVVTGASRGIGRAIAEHFVGEGQTVFAGVRNATDGDRLVRELGPSLRPMILDVTRPDQIEAARKQVESEARPLRALVNNAATMVAAPLEVIEIEEMREQFEVNVFGLLALTQAFLPMLRQHSGRLVNVGSIAGSVSLPFMGPYSASKHALTALTEGLRRELGPTGVHVSLIAAGAIGTDMWSTSLASSDERLANATPELRALYETPYRRGRKRMVFISRHTSPATRVVRSVAHAVASARPKPRYWVGRTALTFRALSAWPDRALDRALRLIFDLPARSSRAS